MSRSDIFAVALAAGTLALGFLLSPSAHLGWLFAGISVVALFSYFLVRKKRIATAPPIRQTTPGHQSAATAVGSIRDIGAGAHVVIGAHPQSGATTHPRSKTIPNLRYAGYRNARVFLSPYAHIGAREPNTAKERDSAIEALVVKIENDPWKNGEGKDAQNVIARIVYRMKRRSVRIDYAVWLDSTIRWTSLDVGDTRELALLFKVDEQFLATEDRREPGVSFEGHWAWMRQEDVADIESIVLTIIDTSTQSKHGYLIELDEVANELRIKPPVPCDE